MAKIVSFNAFLRGTGRSHLMANLATLLAADGKRVGVADLDDSAPTQHLIFGLPEAAMAFTLADSMAGRCRVEQAAYEVTPQEVQGAGEAFSWRRLIMMAPKRRAFSCWTTQRINSQPTCARLLTRYTAHRGVARWQPAVGGVFGLTVRTVRTYRWSVVKPARAATT